MNPIDNIQSEEAVSAAISYSRDIAESAGVLKDASDRLRYLKDHIQAARNNGRTRMEINTSFASQQRHLEADLVRSIESIEATIRKIRAFDKVSLFPNALAESHERLLTRAKQMIEAIETVGDEGRYEGFPARLKAAIEGQ